MLPDNFFKALVLAPCMRAFAQSATLNPVVSQPNAQPYLIAGIWSNKIIDEPMENGSFISTNQPMLGINLGDFPVSPKQLDQIIFQNVVYDITNVRKDGQGGADLILRVASAR